MIETATGVREPPDRMALPHRGCAIAIASHIPEKTVEYIDRSKMAIESQFVRLVCRSHVCGQESTSSVTKSYSQRLHWKHEGAVLIKSSSFPAFPPPSLNWLKAMLEPFLNIFLMFDVPCRSFGSSCKGPQSCPPYLLWTDTGRMKSGRAIHGSSFGPAADVHFTTPRSKFACMP
jgi:hypothetical protein